MYLKMTLAGQLIEERFIPDSKTYDSFLQMEIESLIANHEQTIENADEQPYFLLSSLPTAPKKKHAMVSLLSKLAFFQQLFGS